MTFCSLTRGCMWRPTLEKYIFIEGNTTFSECIKFSKKMVYLCMRTKKSENKKGGKNYSSRWKTSNKGISPNFLGLQKHMKCCVKGGNMWIHIFDFSWWKKYVFNKSWSWEKFVSAPDLKSSYVFGFFYNFLRSLTKPK